MSDTGIVNIHGKEYRTVGLRVNMLREQHPLASIRTKLVSESDDRVIVKATVEVDGVVLGTGYAEEVRGSTTINKTSSLENAETSAVGRALSFAGLGGSEIASADEVANAISQQKEMEAVDRLKVMMGAVSAHFHSIAELKNSLAVEDYSTAYECWQEIPDGDKAKLWVAPSKGGVLTTKEREQMKSDLWNQAKQSMTGE